MKVRDLVLWLESLPQDAHIIRPGEINGDWAMVPVYELCDAFELRHAQHLEAFGEYILKNKAYVNTIPVLVVKDR